jgi:hypothetical protein
MFPRRKKDDAKSLLKQGFYILFERIIEGTS